MDNAIALLKSCMDDAKNLKSGILSKEDMQEEISAYVKAINELERFYYGEARTKLEEVLH